MVDMVMLEQQFMDALWEYFVQHMGNFLFIGLVIAVTAVATRFVDEIYLRLKKKLGEKFGFPLSETSVKLAIYSVATILVVAAIPGVSSSFLQLLGLAGGIIVAFSSSTLIANGMAGVMVRLVKPYSEGDVVQMKGQFGKVYHIGLLHTEIQTLHREVVNVPNLVAISDVVINYSEGDYLVNVKINLGYDVSRSLAEKLLLEAVERTKLKHGFCLMTDLGSFGVDYEVNGLLENPETRMRVESELRKNIFDVFYENEVQIMTPTYMTTKQLFKDEVVLPDEHIRGPRRGVQKPEKLMFERAEEVIGKKEKKKEERDGERRKGGKA